ncbi:hypothetical protein BsWGS_26263 [Bradybaena similaris]
MTSRGNQSVSPPAQISQQRHVNVISSSTPPPQQYYQGSSPALPQVAYEFLTPQAQGQAYSPYQVQYGNAINDIRGQPGNGGRAGPLQQSLSQGGGYYQQHGPSMRPQQIQQAPQASQQYYIGQTPGTFCPRPAQPTSQQMLYYQNFPSGNNLYTIPANMFTGPAPQVPMYQQTQFMQNPTYQTPMMCYPNGTQWRNPVMAPTGPQYITRPQVREKKVLSITDPDTGRNITEEIFSHRVHPADSDDPYEQVPAVNQNNIEIRQTFTRMVADRLKSPDEPGLSGPMPDSQGAMGGAAPSASQQYQLPHQQHMQQPAKGPAPLMRASMNGPPMAMSHQMMPARPGSSQQPPASVTPPQDIAHQMLNIPNLSMPPPQLPGRAPSQAIYNTTPQQPQHVPHPHLSQTPPQQQQQPPQPVRQHMPQAMQTPLQQVQLQAQQSPHHHPSHQPLLNQIPHAPQNQSPPYNQMSAPGMPANPALHQISSGMGINPPAGQHIPSTIVGTIPASQQVVSSLPVNPTGQQIVSNLQVNHAGQQAVSSLPVNPVGQQIVSGLPVNPAGQQIVSNLPANTAFQPVNQLDVVEKPKQQMEVVPQNNIPAKLAGPPVSSPVAKTAPSVKELSPVPTPTEQAGDVKSPPPAKTVASFSREELVAEKTEDNSKEESSQGANAQGVKDGRKGKRNWKINRKDVSGSDMDAFTDNVEETNSEAGETRPHNAQNTEPAVNGAGGHQMPLRQASAEECDTKQSMDTSRGPEITRKDSTPLQKDSTPPLKDSTPPRKVSTPTPKDRTPTPKDRTPTPDSPKAVPLDNRYSKDKDTSHSLKHQDSKDKDSSHTLRHQDSKDRDSSHTLKHQDSKDNSHTLKHQDSKDSSHSLKHQDSKDKDSSHTLKHQDSKDKDSSHTLKHQDSKDKDSSHTLKHQDSQKSASAVSQGESKNKQKKKKKKGHHSPPNQKSKQSSPTDTIEKHSNAVETDSKSSIASPVTDDSSKDSKGQATAPPDSPAALRDTFTVPDAAAPPSLPSTPQEPAKVTDIVQPPPHQLPEASPSLQQPELVRDHTRHSSSPEETTVLKEAAISTTIITASKLDSSSEAENHKATELPASSIQNISEHFDQPVDSSLQEEPSAAESVQTGESVSESSFVNHRIAEQNEAQEYIAKPETESKKEYVSELDGDTVSLRPQSERTVSRVRKDGRLQYDSAYLLELRDCPSSQAKPKGLPDLPEIILDLPITGASRRANTAALDFTPSFFQPSMRNAPPIGGTNSRNRQRPDMIPQRIIKSVSLQDSVKPLHQSEKPWKPTTKQLSAGEIAEKRKTLESGVLFIMNRLTPTNFERLAEEMKELDIHTYEDLQALVRIFFDKVTIETKFVEAYAQLCKVMSSLKVPPPPNSGIKETQATFRVVMLTKCQQEFEADKTSIFEDPEEKRRKMEAELPEGPERDAKIESTLYQMKMRRLKFYGNIRFIGELFKLHMLTENIMHDCIYRLLKARDDDSLLSLCNLIATVGRDLDTERSRTKMDRYFAEMAKIADESKSRIKFTLKDVIDLRKNNWIPRKEQTGPKKIQDVHKDFQQEQATKQFLQSQPLPPRTEPAQSNNRRGNRPRQEDKQVNDDGWNTVGVKVQRIDASKMRLSKSVVDENNIQLGPGGGMKQFSMWTRGSSAVTQPTQDSERPAANRFSALRGEEDRRGFQRSPSRGESGATPARQGARQGPTAGHGRGKVLPRSSQEGERRDSGGRSMQGGRSQNSSRDNSWNREDRRQPVVARGSREGENPMTRSTGSIRPSDTFIPPTVVSSSLRDAAGGYVDGQVVKRAKPLSEEEMEHKAKTILEEYLSAMDLEEAKLCVKELEGQTHISLLVTTSINDVLEKTHRERDLAGSFLHEIVKHGLLPLDVYLKGLGEVLSFAEDMVIDIPKIWTYLAQIIVPMLVGGSLSWSTLSAALKSNLDRKCCVKLVSEILLVAKEKTSEREVAQMWQASNMTWSTFLETEEIAQFLRDKKLQFTVEPVANVAVASQINVQKLVQDVESILRRDGTNEEVIACIDKHAGSDRHDKHFIRSVVAAVVNAAISPTTKKLKEDVLKSRKEVLQCYIKNNAEMELQALYAIQALMHKLEHPSGVIASIFDILYDEEVISEETFKQWEKSSDPQEAEGKGACSMQLTQFFTWLRENEEPEGS